MASAAPRRADQPNAYPDNLIQLPSGGRINAANLESWQELLRLHGALTVLAEGHAPILPAQLDGILDDLSCALERCGMYRRDLEEVEPTLAPA